VRLVKAERRTLTYDGMQILVVVRISSIGPSCRGNVWGCCRHAKEEGVEQELTVNVDCRSLTKHVAEIYSTIMRSVLGIVLNMSKFRIEWYIARQGWSV
jgi:hypothetical protein